MKCKVVKGTKLNGLNLHLQIKGIVEKGLEHLFITSSNSNFFYKTNFKKYILNILHSFIAKNFSIPTRIVYKIMAIENAECDAKKKR